MFVGTNNMLAHFDNLRMNRLQLTLKQFEGFMSSKKKEKEDSDAAKDEEFLGNKIQKVRKVHIDLKLVRGN